MKEENSHPINKVVCRATNLLTIVINNGLIFVFMFQRNIKWVEVKNCVLIYHHIRDKTLHFKLY